jgi:hypothetical protein
MLLPSAFKSVSGPRSPTNFEQWPTPIVGIEPIGAKKGHRCAELGPAIGASTTAGGPIPPRSTAPARFWEPSNQFTARLPEWCDEAAPVHWVQEADRPPSWAEAHRRLQGEGRRSRVSHPSEAQRRL